MTHRRWWLGAALVCAAACSRLLTEKGNAFPCDARSTDTTQCAPGEVCNVNGVCQRFQYEGPQFEGPAQLPVLDGGAAIHPLKFRDAVVQAATSLSDDQHVAALLLTPGGLSALLHNREGAVRTLGPIAAEQVVFDDNLALAVSYEQATGQAQRLQLIRPDGTVMPVPETGVTQSANSGLTLRATSAFDDAFPLVGVLRGGGAADPPFGVVARSMAGTPEIVFGAVTTDGGQPLEPLDVRWISRRPLPVPLFLTADGFYGRAGPWLPGPIEVDRLNAEAFGPLPKQSTDLIRPSLRQEATGSVWAVSYAHLETFPDGGVNHARAPAHTLSTWTLSRDGNVLSFKRLWNDCAPCQQGAIVTFTPVITNAGAGVEVLCAIADQGLSLTRVVGSLAVDPSRACQSNSVASPWVLSEVTRFKGRDALLPRPVIDNAQGDRLTFGGIAGQLWNGSSLSTVKPVFLDRTPFAVGEFDIPEGVGFSNAGRRLAALTEVGVFADYSQNGLARVDVGRFSSAPLGEDVTVQGILGGRQGWMLLSTGDVAKLGLSSADGGTGMALTFGPSLVTARGDRSRGPYFGDALDGLDGGLLSLVVSADDSVYFLPAPQNTLVPGQLGSAVPVLTPEPSSPIRSLALERSAFGTNGVDRVRGYLVTSRNLYSFSLNGVPIRGTAQPIQLGTGEPVEVWMDNPRGGLGRVGYRDGEIFTLPGGFKLVEPLIGDGGTWLQVTDYENLGGWPVALTQDGLFVAYWEQALTEDGKLELKNKDSSGNLTLPMPWHEAALVDGSTPWKGKQARLFVREGPVELLAKADPMDGGAVRQPTRQRFTLYVFVDEAVYEVGSLTRLNRDVVKQ